MIGVTLANDERWNQFRVSIQRDKRPDIAIHASAGGVLTLCADEAPNFINLDILAIQAAHFLILDFGAGCADTQRQPSNSITVNPCYAFHSADARAFTEHRNRRHFLFSF